MKKNNKGKSMVHQDEKEQIRGNIKQFADSLIVKIKAANLSDVEMERAIALLSSERTINDLSNGKSLKLKGNSKGIFSSLLIKFGIVPETKSWNIKFEDGKLDLIWSSKRDTYKFEGKSNVVATKDLWQATSSYDGNITSVYHPDGIAVRRAKKNRGFEYTQNDYASNTKRYITKGKGKVRERVYGINLGVQEWGEGDKDVRMILTNNLPRITAQIFALLDNNCIHMDLGPFQNIVGREVGSKVELNLIDWQRSGDNNVYNFEVFELLFSDLKRSNIRKISPMDRENYKNEAIHAMERNKKLSTILCLCHTVLRVEPANPVANSMVVEIACALKDKHNVTTDDLNRLYAKCTKNLKQYCFGHGNVTQEEINEQAAYLKVEGMKDNIGDIKIELEKVEEVTLEDLKGSFLSQMFGKFKEKIFGSKNDGTVNTAPEVETTSKISSVVAKGGIDSLQKSYSRTKFTDHNDTRSNKERGATRASSRGRIESKHSGLVYDADRLAKKRAPKAGGDHSLGSKRSSSPGPRGAGGI